MITSIYFNIKSVYGVETIDQLDRSDFPTYRAFWGEVKRLLHEYHISGIPVYRSQRCTNDWKER